MLWQDNERENKPAENQDNRIETLQEQSERVQKAYSDVQSLMARLDEFKKKQEDFKRSAKVEEQEAQRSMNAIEEQKRRALAEIEKQRQEEIRLKAQREAEKAARRQAERRAYDEKRLQMEARQRELEARKRAIEEIRLAQKQERLLNARRTRKQAEAARMEAEARQQRNAIAVKKETEDALKKQKKAEQLRILEEANRIHAANEIREQRKVESRKRRAERQQIIEEQRALQKQRREANRVEAKRLRNELEERKREDRLERANIRRQKKLARKSAELGGGVVNVHGMAISTEIRPVSKFSLKDLLGIVTRRDKRSAANEEELNLLMQEAEKRREEARIVAARLRQIRRENFQDSHIGKRVYRFKQFCEERKKPLLVSFSVILTLALCCAGVVNHLTVFEYSYNGKVLGYVKQKEDVTKVTDLVQKALQQDTELAVVIDAEEDISFKRVANLENELPVDSTDEVLKRLTYMGDFNVKAYGIFIDGVKVGAVQDKDTAANVFKDIKARYVSGREGSEVEEAVIMEKIDVKKSNTKLQDISSESEMVEKLCTSGHKETVHVVVAGETLADIATNFATTEEKLLADNENVNPQKLDVGSSILIKQTAPVLTVRITEKVSYEKKIKYETEKKKDKTMYEGDTVVEQKGQNGICEETDRLTIVNGEVTNTDVLNEKVAREPTTKIVLVGTKERPPTIGSGTYIWPTNGSFRISSPYGPRWGRNHDGIDMACSTGTDVLASDGGTVTKAGYHGSYGMLVVVDHQNGVETYYAHNSKLLVKVGDKVYQGQHIAESGSTGRSTGPHIHFGVKVKGAFKNPYNYLPKR